MPAAYADVVRLWRWARPAPGRIVGMAVGMVPAQGHLPEPGGLLDQSAWLMEAFEILSQAEAKFLSDYRQ